MRLNEALPRAAPGSHSRHLALISMPAAPPAVPGSQDACATNLARELARAGSRVDIFTRRDAPGQAQVLQLGDAVRLIRVPAGPAYPVPQEALLPHMDHFARWSPSRPAPCTRRCSTKPGPASRRASHLFRRKHGGTGMKAIFLDKEGALVDKLPQDVEMRVDPRRIRLSSGAGPALRLLARLDYRFVVVSSQPGVAQGRFPEEALHAVGDRLNDLLFRENLSLEGFYYCPHDPQGTVAPYAIECPCRKPLPGLLLQASLDHGIDLRASWMIGDLLHDVEAGNRAGCRTVLLDNGVETEWRLGPRRIPTRMAPDLYAAAVLIATHHDHAQDNDA